MEGTDVTVTMESTDMFLFSDRQAKSIIESLGAKVVKSASKGCQEKKVMLKDDKQACCEACGEHITFDSLGHIAKGSLDFYCDKPACFTHFIANKKIR